MPAVSSRPITDHHARGARPADVPGRVRRVAAAPQRGAQPRCGAHLHHQHAQDNVAGHRGHAAPGPAPEPGLGPTVAERQGRWWVLACSRDAAGRSRSHARLVHGSVWPSTDACSCAQLRCLHGPCEGHALGTSMPPWTCDVRPVHAMACVCAHDMPWLVCVHTTTHHGHHCESSPRQRMPLTHSCLRACVHAAQRTRVSSLCARRPPACLSPWTSRAWQAQPSSAPTWALWSIPYAAASPKCWCRGPSWTRESLPPTGQSHAPPEKPLGCWCAPLTTRATRARAAMCCAVCHA